MSIHLVNIVRIFISVAYVYNSCEGQERMQLGIAFEIVDELGTCVLVVACCFVIATWYAATSLDRDLI